MKKTFTTLFAVLIASVTMAAGHVDSVRYLTTKFGRNWFISVDGSVDWWKGSDQNLNGNYTAIQWEKPDFGGSISLGKWINHKLGLRVSYDINGGKVWANKNISGPNSGNHWMFDLENGTHDEYGYYLNNFIYHNLHGDVMISPVDFFQGYYNPNRIYTPVIYLGMGAACVGDQILVLTSEHRNFELSADAGLINNFRLSDYLDLHLDFKYSLQRWSIDSWEHETTGFFYSDGTPAPIVVDENGISQPVVQPETGDEGQSVRPKRLDQNFSVGLGLTFYLRGRVYDLPYNYEKEMKEMNDRIKNLEDELANQPIPEAVHDTIVKFVTSETEAISYPFSIFFNLESYELMSGRDRVNLREIAKAAKENNYKLYLRGSADSSTGSTSYNQTLSENRCNKIKIELLEMGVPAENIILEPMGGVKELDPTEYDRRVLIYIGK